MAATNLYQQPLQSNGVVDQAGYDQTHYLTGVFCRALYDYQSNDASSLSFHRGDIIEVLTQLESGWWDGLLNDERGWFPSNYVSIMNEQDLEQEELSRVANMDHQEHWGRDVQNEVPGQLSDFWVPSVAPNGRIFYVNTQTGEQSNELPTEIESDVEPLINGMSSRSVSTLAESTAYSVASTSATTVAGEPQAAGFGLPKRSGTPEPWVKRLADDGMSYYYQNTVDGTTRWTAPSPPPQLAHQSEVGLAYTNGRSRAGSSAGRDPERLSVYSDDSDVNPLGILGRAAAHAHTTSKAPANAPSLHSQPPESPEIHAAKELQNALQERFPLEPDSLDDLAEAARSAISDLVDIALARNNTSLIKDAIKRTTDSVRNLVYASSTLLGPMNTLPQPYTSTTGFSDISELKAFHRKVTACMVKLITAIRASMGAEVINSDMSARFENDAAELGRAISTFVDEVLQRRTNQTSARHVRAVLHSASGSQGVGRNLIGAGTAGSWKGFGFVGSVTGKALSADSCKTVQQHKDDVDMILATLESIIPTGEVPDIIQTGRDALQRLVIYLGLVSDMNIASTLDVDSDNLDAAYTENVKRSRELLRSLENTVQAAFEDAALLLNMIQSANSPSPLWKALATTVPALRSNISDIYSHIVDLTQISQSQAEACAKAGVQALVGYRNASQPSTEESTKTVDYSDDGLLNGEHRDSLVKLEKVLDGSTWGNQPARRNPGVYGPVDSELSNSSRSRSAAENNENDPPRGSSGATISRGDTSRPSPPTEPLPHPNGNAKDFTSDEEDDFDPEPPRSKARAGKISGRALKIKNILGQDAPDAYIQNANADAKPWYLRPEHGSRDIWLNPEGGVRGGTLPALIERLTMHDTRDTVFNSTFLLTFKSFTTLDELFEGLVKRFYLPTPEGLSPDELKEWTEKKLQVVRFRVINIMKQMVTDENVLEKEDLFILDRIKEFAATVDKEITPPIPAAKLLIDTVDRARKGSTDGMIKRTPAAPTYLPAPIIPKSNKLLKLLDIDPLEMARQLTLMESRLFAKIRPMECLNRGRDKKNSDHEDNISAIIDTSNKVAEWVADSILSKDEARKRAAIVKHFISIADRCRLLQNFSTMAALVAGLNSPPIRRLKRTWEQVNQRSKAQLQEAERTMDTNKNFTNYRAILKSAQLPCVPFFGVYLSVLTFIQDGNKNNIQGELINFSKREKFAEVVREIQHYQSKLYSLTPVSVVEEFILEQLSALGNTPDSSDRTWNLSLEREPREREDEKMARLLQESGFI
ncbi:hypothetical protein M422DRAFT_200705 [Sphaerobolus stellatus SS14]|nr:hypothetical protein M422DRAFT_200705 [Sphaerobolus stellatus SS14]